MTSQKERIVIAGSLAGGLCRYVRYVPRCNITPWCTLPQHYHRAVLFAVLAGALEFAKPRLSTAWKYAKVEMRPPGPSEWGQAANEAGQFVKSITTGKFLQQTTTVSLPQELFNIT